MLKFSIVFSIFALGACTEEPIVHSSTSPVTCSGSCDFGASEGDGEATTNSIVGFGNVQWANGAWFIPIVEPVGTSITSVSMVVVDLTGDPVVARFTVNGQTVGSVQSSGAGVMQTLTVPVGRAVASGDVDALVLTPVNLGDSRMEFASTGHVSTGPVPPATTAQLASNSIVGRAGTSVVYTGVASFSGIALQPLPVIRGTVITGFSANVIDRVGGAVIAVLDATDRFGNSQDLASTNVSTGTGTAQTLSAVTSITVSPDTAYYFVYKTTNGSVSVTSSSFTSQ